MANDSSEEKSLPASEKKLRDAREKGQVPQSKDMVSAISLTTCILYLAIMFQPIQQRAEALLTQALAVFTRPLDAVLPELLPLAATILALTVVPLIILVTLSALITQLLIMKGFVFSATPLTPSFERVNPVAGFKRIFSGRSFAEFLKTLIKLTIVAAALLIVFRNGIQTLVESSYCGPGCISGAFFSLLLPLVITALLTFLAVGAVDILVQRWLFGREMRMSVSEQKQERKNMDGDPKIRQARKRARRELLTGSPVKKGIEHASLLLSDPHGWTVGIRYVKGETPAPMVVLRVRSDSGQSLTDSSLRLPLVVNPELAAQVASRPVGQPVPESTFQQVANLLIRSGVL